MIGIIHPLPGCRARCVPDRHTGDVVSVGSVRVFHLEEGWGVIDSPKVPGGCWVHFSAIEVDGYRELCQGQRVVFEAELADQDGYAYRAVRVQVEPAHNEPASTEPTSTGPVNGEQ